MKGEKILGETVFGNITEIDSPIDIVDVFRPSKETPGFAKEAVKIGAKTLWLQYGIQNEEAKKISEEADVKYIENKCIKQEYQKLFQISLIIKSCQFTQKVRILGSGYMPKIIAKPYSCFI